MNRKKLKGGKYSPRTEKELALICLSCPLPAAKCRPHICKRYKTEAKKIFLKDKGQSHAD